jgi:hypothetical protein
MSDHSLRAHISEIIAALDFRDLADYAGFKADGNGFVHGQLPPDCPNAEYSTVIEAAGYEVEVIRFDDGFSGDFEPSLVLAAWQPKPPKGDGWTLAWKSDDEDGMNAVFWRAKGDRR